MLKSADMKENVKAVYTQLCDQEETRENLATPVIVFILNLIRHGPVGIFLQLNHHPQYLWHWEHNNGTHEHRQALSTLSSNV